MDNELQASRRFLEIANQHTELKPLLHKFIAEIQKMTRCEAVGIRILDDNGNISYREAAGSCM